MVGSGAVRNVVARSWAVGRGGPCVAREPGGLSARPHLTQTYRPGILSMKQPTNASHILVSSPSLSHQNITTHVANVPIPQVRLPNTGVSSQKECPMSQLSQSTRFTSHQREVPIHRNECPMSQLSQSLRFAFHYQGFLTEAFKEASVLCRKCPI